MSGVLQKFSPTGLPKPRMGHLDAATALTRSSLPREAQSLTQIDFGNVGPTHPLARIDVRTLNARYLFLEGQFPAMPSKKTMRDYYTELATVASFGLANGASIPREATGAADALWQQRYDDSWGFLTRGRLLETDPIHFPMRFTALMNGGRFRLATDLAQAVADATTRTLFSGVAALAELDFAVQHWPRAAELRVATRIRPLLIEPDVLETQLDGLAEFFRKRTEVHRLAGNPKQRSSYFFNPNHRAAEYLRDLNRTMHVFELT